MKLNTYLPPKILSDFLYYYDIKWVAYTVDTNSSTNDILTLDKPKIEGENNILAILNGNNIFTINMKRFDQVEFTSERIVFFNDNITLIIEMKHGDGTSLENKLRETGYIN